MSGWLERNFNLVVLSLVLAFFFWAVATEAEDPTVTATFSSSVPIEVVNDEEANDLIAYGLESTRVRITLRAPQSVWDRLESDDILAYVDLSTVTTGTVTMPVHVEISQEPIRIMETNPSIVTLKVEPRSEKEVLVNVRQHGSPAIGYRADSPVIAPRLVTVQGPASFVEQVVGTEVEVELDGQLDDLTSDLQPVPVDAEGEPVPNVKVIPKTVTVHVPVRQQANIRDMAVKVTLEGQPAAGYRVADLKVNPQVVTVFGRSSALQAAAGFLTTEPVSMEEITQSITTNVALQMPEGLAVLQPPAQVTVTIAIEAILSSLNLEVEPEIRGLSNNLTATMELETIVVLLSGPLSVMEELSPEDVQLVLDLSNLGPGEYAIAPRVTVPDRVQIENIIPESVPVRIERGVPTTPERRS